MQDVSVGIKAFLRQEELHAVLEALENLDIHEVIVADDSGLPEERVALYEDFHGRLPLTVLEMPFDSGVSRGRNWLISQCRTEYLLLLDDDHVVLPEIRLLREAIEIRPDMGGVSGIWQEWGKLKCSAANLQILGNVLYRDLGRGVENIGFVRDKPVLRYDFIPLGGIFRTECLRDVVWDETYKTAREHVDYFLEHKRLGRWCFGIVDTPVLEHRPVDKVAGTGEYRKYRHDAGRHHASKSYFRQKWDVRKVVAGRTHTRRKSDLRERLVHAWVKCCLMVLGERALRGGSVRRAGQ